MTTTLLNTNTCNYTFQRVRSYDPFRLCIRAENVNINKALQLCVQTTVDGSAIWTMYIET